jgi:pimeloyl-ACP methyl ester carboxylesterase
LVLYFHRFWWVRGLLGPYNLRHPRQKIIVAVVVFVQDDAFAPPYTTNINGLQQKEKRQGEKIMRTLKTKNRRNKWMLSALTILMAVALLSGCTYQIIDEGTERTNTMNTQTEIKSGYVSVNGLEMYYEMQGTGRPLVLLHGALSATGTSFGKVIPTFAQDRQVISFEQQAHGHTADIDRPLTIEQMGEDTAAALRELGIENADIFGYSMGAGIALQIAVNHPDLVHKLVIASVTYNADGFHPGLIEGMAFLEPEMLVGSPWHDEYMNTAPNPDDFPNLIAKVKEMNLGHIPSMSAEQIQQIQAPTLLLVGDSDIIRLEHAVEMFRLLGGGVNGDVDGLPRSQLAILPGTSHTMMVERGDLLSLTITAFLDAPMPEAQ